MIDWEVHWCKACKQYFKLDLESDTTGDFFLVCPNCQRKHYRYFEHGQVIHCDIAKRKSEPIEIRS
jgi:hypothetical protein